LCTWKHTPGFFFGGPKSILEAPGGGTKLFLGKKKPPQDSKFHVVSKRKGVGLPPGNPQNPPSPPNKTLQKLFCFSEKKKKKKKTSEGGTPKNSNEKKLGVVGHPAEPSTPTPTVSTTPHAPSKH